MTDDVSRLLGRLEAGVEAIIDRVNRSDDATAQKFTGSPVTVGAP